MRTHSARTFSIAAIAASLVALAAFSPAVSSPKTDSASYTMTFVPTWNPQTHPYEYPVTHAKGGLLTPMIGATHGSDFRLFDEGMPPSPGLEKLSEMGKHDPLDGEIRRAIEGGSAGALLRLSTGSPGPTHASVSYRFDIDSDNPMVSLVGMIAPSPDWFYGISGVRLRKGSRWLSQTTVTAYAWDSGGDAGTTYMAEDRDLSPKQATRYANGPHFTRNGKKVPIGVFVFTRIPDAGE